MSRGGDGMPQISRELQEFVQQENTKMEFRAFAAKVTEGCFEKCISAPGKSLSSGENDCLEKCAARFLDATQMLNQRLSSMK
mmetsp:Transcript_26410/g.50159  ORF Transcript_26410/g.50159 Transcript_26410/m.50159 type:complete len:82 (+) Transcript_26410:90-335(+)|eukprot:CAMPEP_0114227602 /NCGR_PEP_ID=MMETSP0058-20121206/1878_1 /TAXON_ID=36894 /ORGANISM="Pyramimonas parkeae, CCMP726" /LENGTH=81 /DNA_ID=CAMNT_0001338455 /DNA_START=85 /DNA_END=330 /DNA_ORIENTATION=-